MFVHISILYTFIDIIHIAFCVFASLRQIGPTLQGPKKPAINGVVNGPNKC